MAILQRTSRVFGDEMDAARDPPRIADVLQVEACDVMLVGHMPHLDRLRRHLLDEALTPQPLPPRGVVALERDTAGWAERWQLQPGSPA